MSVKRENIEKWSGLYHYLKYYVDFSLHCYYRITTVGRDKLNLKEPLIFVGNHQNALIDNLAILALYTWQPVFLARSDIFKNKFHARILTFLKMLPIFRIRDGYSALQENDAIFKKTIDVLQNHNGLVIMPEGNHLGKRRLRPLKKGVARIAFQAEEALEFKMGIKIVPVGFDYSDYKTVGSTLFINIGEPVAVAPFIDLYRTNPAQAYNALLQEIAEAMKNVMLHIEDEVHYDEVFILTELALIRYKLNNKKASVPEGFNVKKKRIAELEELSKNSPAEYELIIEKAKSFITFLQQNKLKPAELLTVNTSLLWTVIQSLILLITFPVFAFSFMNLILPLALTRYASSRFQDHHFIASVRLVVGLVTFPLFFILQTILFGIISGSLLHAIAYFVTLPLSAIFVFHWQEQFYLLRSKFKVLAMRIFKPEKFRQLINGINL
ncbi:MAG: 1-acyl-sn-glycerol-3-phosphate acyltransferase [Bacteroidales bacterium]